MDKRTATIIADQVADQILAAIRDEELNEECDVIPEYVFLRIVDSSRYGEPLRSAMDEWLCHLELQYNIDRRYSSSGKDSQDECDLG